MLDRIIVAMNAITKIISHIIYNNTNMKLCCLQIYGISNNCHAKCSMLHFNNWNELKKKLKPIENY